MLRSAGSTRDDVDGPAEQPGARLALAVLAGAAAVALWGGVSLRGLYGDGAAYLHDILVGSDFALHEPPRLAAQVLQQLPAILAARSGAVGLAGVERIWSVWLELLPILLVAACWAIIPRARRGLALFPVLHLLTGTMAGSAYPMAEGAVAAAYFWLLLTAVQFGGERPAGRVLVTLLALPALLLHEVFAALAPLLALAAWLRARESAAPSARRWRLGLAAWFVLVTAYQLRWMIVPHKPLEARVLSHQILRLWFVTDLHALNVAAALGLVGLGLALALLAHARFARAPATSRWPVAATAAFAALCAAGLVAAVLSARCTPAWLQFSARTTAALVSVPLAAVAVWVWRRPSPPWSGSALRAVVLALAVAQLGWHVVEIGRWRAGVAALRAVVSTGRGFVPWRAALASLPASQAVAMPWIGGGWTTPDLSVLLAPEGRVRAVVGAAGGVESPPAAEKTVPRSRFWDASEYLAALSAGPGS